ncbi:MAG: gliding motility-associated C-terminal domain-containing protein [Bacteroidales bacterium]
MLPRRKIYLTLILLGLFLGPGHAQTESVSGIINHYAAIETILAWESNNVDSVLLTDATGFNPGDTVMIYCVQGAEIELTNIFGEGDIGRDAQNPRNTGKYAFLIIDKIDGNTVVFNTSVRPEIGPMGPGEVAQLIRVPSYHSALVMPSGVTAQDWNGSTGGVVALFVRTVLELNGDINVSGKGFRGAVASTPYYNGDCSSVNPVLYDSNFYHIDHIRAGIKGEGTTDTRFDLMRGKARNINGGGGGNARFSGGGGGSNFSSGGKGGNESALCAPGALNLGGAGGFDLGRNDAYYINVASLNRHNRIFFGGGGGTGTVISGRTTTGGGDGGGLVIIIADTIRGNGNWIRANGSSVTANATGAGGGGGGGGAILLDVSGYKDNPRLSAAGGSGGNTNHLTDATGPGGGGGGGIFWLAGTDEPGVSPDETGFGASGMYLTSGIKNGAADGAPPKRKDGLDAPLRGFLFNSVPSEFWVCSDQVPDPILASKPKGGSGSYSYSWIDSSSTQNQWQVVPGATGQSLTFNTPLADTTYFRRIVKEVPQILPPDTSFRIAVYVHQAITNNTISAPDTVCQGNIPVPFVPVGSPGAGIGTYTYSWQKDEGSGIYSPADGTNTQPGYVPPAGLNVSTHFARVTTSGACVDTSAALRITVFAPISGNIIADYDTICVNTAPERIIQNPEFTLGGGDPDPTNWRYRWQSGPLITGPWAEVAGATVSAYQPGNLTATIWYRREVLSGNGDACVDFSTPVEILNVPVITNNLITSADQTVCTGDQPELMQGSVPGGGHPAQIYYKWESSTAETGWVEADNTNGNNLQSYTPPVMTGDTTFYRRVVSSGGQEGVCKNTSAAKTIQVLPAISGNRILTDVTVNCQFDFLAGLMQNPASGAEPGGGATQGGNDPTRNYRWEQATGTVTPGPWSQVSYGPAELNYTDHPQLGLSEDYWYRRVVLSGPSLGGQNQVCSQVSDTIHIVIHTAISGNEIDPADSACLNTEKVLHGEMPTGDSEEATLYSWRDFATGAEMGTGKDLPYTFTALDSRQFNRIVVIGECEDTSGNMSITMMELPGGTLAGDLPKACEKDVLLEVDLNIEDLVQYLTPWEISLSDGVHAELLDPQLLDGDGTVEVKLSTDALSTQYHYTIGKLLYRLTDGTECVAPAQNLVGNVPIEVFMTPDPVITVTTELTDSSVCDNEVSLVVDPDHGTGSWASDFPGKLGFLPDPLALSVRASIDPTDPDAWAHLPYTLYFTSEAGDCSGTDTVKISFFEQPEPPYAGEDDTIYLTNTVKLNADPPTAGVGTWTVTVGSGDFEDEHDPKTLVYGLDKGERNEFKWEIVNGVCVFDDDFTVITQDEAQPYEGISPNGDQVNDYFIIRGLAEATEFSISIFNALGNSVRTITRENIGEIDYDAEVIEGGLREDEMVVWDGKADNGNLVPAGTYYYVLNVKIDQKDGSTDKLEKKHYIIVRE